MGALIAPFSQSSCENESESSNPKQIFHTNYYCCCYCYYYYYPFIFYDSSLFQAIDFLIIPWICQVLSCRWAFTFAVFSTEIIFTLHFHEKNLSDLGLCSNVTSSRKLWPVILSKAHMYTHSYTYTHFTLYPFTICIALVSIWNYYMY